MLCVEQPTYQLGRRFCQDFARRFLSLLSGPFRELAATLSLSILAAAMRTGTGAALSQDEIDAGAEAAAAVGEAGGAEPNSSGGSALAKPLGGAELQMLFLPHDIKRLEAYSKNLVDFHMVTDLLARVASLFFQRRLPEAMTLSQLQRALLVGMGLQFRTVEQLAKEYDLPTGQLLALFNKAIRKLSSCLGKVQELQAVAEVEGSATMQQAARNRDKLRDGTLNAPLATSLEAEQQREGRKAADNMKASQAELLQSLDLDQFVVGGTEAHWEKAEAQLAGAAAGGIVSVQRDTPHKSASASKPASAKRSKEQQSDRFAARASTGKKHKRG